MKDILASREVRDNSTASSELQSRPSPFNAIALWSASLYVNHHVIPTHLQQYSSGSNSKNIELVTVYFINCP